MLRRRISIRYGCNVDTVLLAAIAAVLWSCVVGVEYLYDEPVKISLDEHICEEVTLTNRTVLRRSSFICTVREQVRCTSWFKLDMCTKYRKKVCYHNVSVEIPTIITERICCPGWAEDDNGSCTQAVCPGGCDNGGVCGADPANGNITKCLCPGGLTGNRCETDIDECTERNDTCSHMCGNTFGSYFCACFAGNVLAPDGVSCVTNTSTEDNDTLSVAPLYDQRPNDTTMVMLWSFVGGAAVTILILLCVVVVRVRRKRESLEDRMDAPRVSAQNTYIGLTEFDRVDDSVLVLADAVGVQESSTDDSPAFGRTESSRFRVAHTGGNEYVIDGEYASHWYEDADVDGAAACACPDATPRKPGKSNPTGSLTYDYAYGVTPTLNSDATTDSKPGSDHYECVATNSPYDYVYGTTPERHASRKVRLPETKDGYLTPICVCSSPTVDRDGAEVPSVYLHCDDAPDASVCENSVVAENRSDSVADGGYVTTEGPDDDGDDKVYQNTLPSCGHCSVESAKSDRGKERQCTSGDHIYMLPVPRPRQIPTDSTNSTDQNVYVKCDVDKTDELIYCNTLPATTTTSARSQDTSGDTQMGSSCSTLSKTDDTGLDDSDYVSGDVYRDSADYENWDSPMRDEAVYENYEV